MNNIIEVNALHKSFQPGLWGLSVRGLLPASADLFRAMGAGSSLLAHCIPWTAMGLSLGLSMVLFLAALSIVQTR